jgi:hypothetical protein
MVVKILKSRLNNIPIWILTFILFGVLILTAYPVNEILPIGICFFAHDFRETLSTEHLRLYLWLTILIFTLICATYTLACIYVSGRYLFAKVLYSIFIFLVLCNVFNSGFMYNQFMVYLGFAIVILAFTAFVTWLISDGVYFHKLRIDMIVQKKKAE